MLKKIFGPRASTASAASTGPSRRQAAAHASHAATASADTYTVSAPGAPAGTAARRLPKEFRTLSKLIAAKELTGYSDLECVDDKTNQWSVRVRLDEGTLAQDLAAYGKRHGQDYLQLRVDFPDDFPHQPPMVWVQSPQLVYRTGFVSRGAVCNEMLVNTGGTYGWQPTYRLEAVLTTIRANFQDASAGGRIHNPGRRSSYTRDEAVAGLARARQQHGNGRFVEASAPGRNGAGSSSHPAGTSPGAAPRAAGVAGLSARLAGASLDAASGKLRPAGFPARLEDLAWVSHLRGTTAPQLLRDAAGRRFVAKQDPVAAPGLVDHEFQVLQAYEALGIKVPSAHLYATPHGHALLSDFIDGTELGCLTGAARSQAEGRVRQGFVADALLGAWDAVGARGDNVIVDAHGEAWRVDNGCGYDRRARGGTKTAAQFGAKVGELSTLRTVKDQFSEVRHAILSAVTDADIRSQRDQIAPKKEALLAAVPAKHRKVMAARWDSLMRY